MTSVAEQRRRQRSRTATRALQVAIERSDPSFKIQLQERVPSPPKYQRRITGLLWLRRLGAIDEDQAKAGGFYGQDYRFSVMESGAQLRSSLDFEERGGGGSRGGLPSVSDCSFLIVQAREAITLARAELRFHEGMILACDLVCGRQLTPREITPVQREAEQVVTELQVALDLLVVHYRAAGRYRQNQD